MGVKARVVGCIYDEALEYRYSPEVIRSQAAVMTGNPDVIVKRAGSRDEKRARAFHWRRVHAAETS